MKNNNDTLSHSPHRLLHDLQALVTEAEKMIGNSASEPNEEILASLRARFAAAQECLTGLYAGARKNVIAGARCTDGAIRANPYESLAIAGGVGLLIGVLAGRRWK